MIDLLRVEYSTVTSRADLVPDTTNTGTKTSLYQVAQRGRVIALGDIVLDVTDPLLILTRADFARGLTLLRERAGLTVRDVARAAGMQASTVGGYFGGKHLPPLKPQHILPDILRACGVTDDAAVAGWQEALIRVRRTPGPRPADAPIPYRGLASFQPEDSDWFFGREALTQVLLDHVIGQTPNGSGLTLVIGPSGAGKSSLLRAGLVAELARVDADAPRQWRCELITPGPSPLKSMADGLTNLVGRPVDVASTTSGAWRDAAHEPTPDPWPRRVLVIDQFEETFTACGDEGKRRAFIAAITAAAAPATDGRAAGAQVVLGMRADFYAQLLNHLDLARVAQGAQVVVGPMTADELRRAIEQPAHKAKADIESGLVELFLRDMQPARDAPDAGAYDAGALPLLSHALLATWERCRGRRLTVADYTDIGGIHGAVAQTAERVYAGLTDEQRELVPGLLARMVIVSEDTADTRRRVPLAELSGDENLAEVLDLFVDKRLITADAETVEFSHEALIRAWPRLRGWIDADRAGLAFSQQVAEAATRWDRGGRDVGALYRGAQLAAAKDRVETSAGLSQLSVDFVQAGIRHERRRTRRLYQTIGALAGLLLVAVAAGAVAIQQRSAAVDQRAAATRERNAAISRLVATTADRVRDKDVALAAQLSIAAYRITPTAEARASLLDSAATYSATRVLGGSGVMQSVALTPDRRTLAAAGADKAVRLWDVTNPHTPTLLGPVLTGPTDTVFSVAISPDGRTLAAGGGDKTVRLWDITDPRHPVPVGQPLSGPTALVYSVAFSPDGRTLVAGSGDTMIHRWDVSNPQQATVLGTPLAGAGSYIQSVAFNPTGTLLAAGSDDHTVRLWDVRDRNHPAPVGQPLTGSTRRIYAVAFSPDGATLAIGSADSNVYLWNIADPGHPTLRGAPISGVTGWVNAVAFNPSGTTLAFASSSSAVQLWDLHAQKITATLPHPGPVTAVTYRGDNTLVTSAADGIARIWHLPGPVLTGHDEVVNGVAFSPDGQTLAIASGGTQLWNVAERRQIGTTLPNAARFSSAIAFTPDGHTLAVGSRDGTVQLWDVSTPGTPTRAGPPITAHSLTVETLAFSPNDHILASGSDDNTARLWDVTHPARPQPLASLDGFASYVYSVAFSPDGRLLAAASIDKTVRIWALDDPHRPALLGQPLAGFDHYALAVAFSPDGRTLAVGSADKTLRLFDMTNPGRPVRLGQPLGGPTNYVYSLAFSRDGRTLAAANTDETVWLWDVSDRTTPHVLATLTIPNGAVYSVAFHPDGRTLAAGGAGKAVWLWTVDPERVLTQICASAGDPITQSEWERYIPGLRHQNPCVGN